MAKKFAATSPPLKPINPDKMFKPIQADMGKDKTKKNSEKTMLCLSTMDSKPCRYGSTCIYAHSLKTQIIKEDRREAYKIITSKNNLKDVKLEKDGSLYKSLLELTQKCLDCFKRRCVGGYNCKKGACNLETYVCEVDLLSGMCTGCKGVHLTERGLEPYLSQNGISMKNEETEKSATIENATFFDLRKNVLTPSAFNESSESDTSDSDENFKKEIKELTSDDEGKSDTDEENIPKKKNILKLVDKKSLFLKPKSAFFNNFSKNTLHREPSETDDVDSIVSENPYLFSKSNLSLKPFVDKPNKKYAKNVSSKSSSKKNKSNKTDGSNIGQNRFQILADDSGSDSDSKKPNEKPKNSLLSKFKTGPESNLGEKFMKNDESEDSSYDNKKFQFSRSRQNNKTNHNLKSISRNSSNENNNNYSFSRNNSRQENNKYDSRNKFSRNNNDSNDNENRYSFSRYNNRDRNSGFAKGSGGFRRNNHDQNYSPEDNGRLSKTSRSNNNSNTSDSNGSVVPSKTKSIFEKNKVIVKPQENSEIKVAGSWQVPLKIEKGTVYAKSTQRTKTTDVKTSDKNNKSNSYDYETDTDDEDLRKVGKAYEASSLDADIAGIAETVFSDSDTDNSENEGTLH